MAVLKNLRNLSEMEFYKNAIGIRRDVTLWMLKEFGLKRNMFQRRMLFLQNTVS